MPTLAPHSKKNVCYYYDGDVGNYYYGQGHPMKPHRIRMAHNLLLNYGLYRKMEIYRPHKANMEEMTKYHSDDYIRFLRSIRPDNMNEHSKQVGIERQNEYVTRIMCTRPCISFDVMRNKR